MPNPVIRGPSAPIGEHTANTREVEGRSFTTNKFELLDELRAGPNVISSPVGTTAGHANLATASPTTNTTIVYHLAQVHRFPGMHASPRAIDVVARSQFEVAKFILNHPKSVVLSENVSEDHTLERRDEDLSMAVTTIFPFGLPSSFDECSPLQRKVLAEEGGDRTLFYLGKVAQIYAAVHGEERLKIQPLMRSFEKEYGPALGVAISLVPEVRAVAMDARESACLSRARELARAADAPDASLIVVFGALHDFKDEFSSDQGFELKSIDLSFLEPKARRRLQMGLPADARDVSYSPSKTAHDYHDYLEVQLRHIPRGR